MIKALNTLAVPWHNLRYVGRHRAPIEEMALADIDPDASGAADATAADLPTGEVGDILGRGAGVLQEQ